jgi:predicted Zn-ribbon and HTH transcriptional regulator
LRKKTLGIKKMFRCKKCGNISTNQDSCPRCKSLWEQEPVKKAWKSVREEQPEMKDVTLDGTNAA